MRYGFTDEFCLAMKGVNKDFKSEWGWVRYRIDDKMFAAVCLDGQGKPYYITLKVDPGESEELRSKYADIIPGYYCDKRNWISVKPDGEVPDELLKELLKKAYALVLGKLSKKRRAEIDAAQ